MVNVNGHDYRTVEVWLDCHHEEGLYGVDVYPRGSVRAGETSYVWLGPYSDHESSYPGLGDNGRGRPPVARMSDNAPSWFDPRDAGERWSDDY